MSEILVQYIWFYGDLNTCIYVHILFLFRHCQNFRSKFRHHANSTISPVSQNLLLLPSFFLTSVFNLHTIGANYTTFGTICLALCPFKYMYLWAHFIYFSPLSELAIEILSSYIINHVSAFPNLFLSPIRFLSPMFYLHTIGGNYSTFGTICLVLWPFKYLYLCAYFI